MQASNFGGTFDKLFLWVFYDIFKEDASLLPLYYGAKVSSSSRHWKLYLSYVRPTLEYGCPVWHASITAEQALCLERIQASVARRLLHADWMEPKNKLLQQLGWPGLRWRRAISSITLFHQMKVAPISQFVNQLPASSLSRSGRSLRKREQLLLPPAHTIKFMYSFSTTRHFFGTHYLSRFK